MVFTPGLNVFIGKNSAGKTIFFKLIKMCCTSGTRFHKNSKDLIRRNADMAIGIFTLSDGSCGGLKIQKNLIQYLYRPEGASVFESSLNPIPQFIEKLGLIVDGDFILNVLDADQELLLVNSSPKTNFSLVKLIAFSEKLDALIVDSKDNSDSYEAIKREYESSIRIIDGKISMYEYTDVSLYERAISFCEIAIPLLQDCIELYKNLELLTFSTPLNISDLTNQFDILGDLLDLNANLDNLLYSRQPNESIIEWLDLLNSVSYLGTLLSQLHINRVLYFQNKLNNTLNILKTSGMIVNCPILGEVLYSEDQQCEVITNESG